MFMNKQNQGFTLIEVVIVITIIGILAVVVLAALGESRAKSRNAAVVSQMYEYQKALELYYTDTGAYPSSMDGVYDPTSVALRRRIYCIGEEYTSTVGCLPFSQNLGNNAHVETELVPGYISKISHIKQNQDTSTYELGSPAYRGCSDLQTGSVLPTGGSNCTVNDYSIFFALEGTNQDCGRAHQVNPNYLSEGFTVCQISNAQ